MKEKYKAEYQNRFRHERSKNLNDESFYEEMGIRERWIRLDKSIDEITEI